MCLHQCEETQNLHPRTKLLAAFGASVKRFTWRDGDESVAVYRQDQVRELRVPARHIVATFVRNNRRVVTSVKGMTNEGESLPQRFGIQPGLCAACHMSCAGQHIFHFTKLVG